MVVFCLCFNTQTQRLAMGAAARDTMRDVLACQPGLLYSCALVTLPLKIMNGLMPLSRSGGKEKHAPVGSRSDDRAGSSAEFSLPRVERSDPARQAMLVRAGLPLGMSSFGLGRHPPPVLLPIFHRYLFWYAHCYFFETVRDRFLLPRNNVDDYASLMMLVQWMPAGFLSAGFFICSPAAGSL